MLRNTVFLQPRTRTSFGIHTHKTSTQLESRHRWIPIDRMGICIWYKSQKIDSSSSTTLEATRTCRFPVLSLFVVDWCFLPHILTDFILLITPLFPELLPLSEPAKAFLEATITLKITKYTSSAQRSSLIPRICILQHSMVDLYEPVRWEISPRRPPRSVLTLRCILDRMAKLVTAINLLPPTTSHCPPSVKTCTASLLYALPRREVFFRKEIGRMLLPQRLDLILLQRLVQCQLLHRRRLPQRRKIRRSLLPRSTAMFIK